jgi:hypothetical protein
MKKLIVVFLSGDYPSKETKEVRNVTEGIEYGSEVLRQLTGDDEWFCVDTYENDDFIDEPKAIGWLTPKGFVEIIRDKEEMRQFIEEKAEGDCADCDEMC